MATVRNISWLHVVRKHRTFMNLLIALICLSVGVMSVSTFFIYKQFSTATTKEIAESSRSLLAEQASSFQYMMEWASSYALTSSMLPSVLSWALASETNEYQDYQIWLKLKEIKANNPFIGSIYLANGYTRKIVDLQSGTSDFASFYDQDIISRLLQMKPQDGRMLYLRQLDNEQDQIRYTGQYATQVFHYEPGRSGSAFIVNLKASSFRDYLKKSLREGDDREILVLDERSLVVSGPDAGQFLAPSPVAPPSDAHADGWRTDKRQGRLFVFADLPFPGAAEWTVVETIPLNKVGATVDRLRQFTYWFYSLLLMVTLAIIWAVAKKIYSPIKSLVDDVNRSLDDAAPEAADGPDPHNEFDLLSRTFDHQRKQIYRLTDQWRQTAHAGKEMFIRDLLRSGLAERSPQERASLFRKYDLAVSPRPLAILIFRIDRFDRFQAAYSANARQLIGYALANIIAETLRAHAPAEAVDMRSDHVAAICEANRDRFDALPAIAAECQRNCETYLHLSLTAAIGELAEEPSALHELYWRAYDRTNERFNRGPGKCFAPADAPDLPDDERIFVYPDDRERQILNAVRLEHREEALEAARKFLEQLESYPYLEIKLFLMKFIVSLTRTLKQMKLDFDMSGFATAARMEQCLDRMESLDDFEAWFRDILLRLPVKQAASSSVGHLVEKMKSVARERCLDPNLSTKSIANDLNLSVVYIRQLFKEETGQSLSDYITELRLEQVRKLLAETSESVEEIARRSGFTAVNSFYAIFKRNVGVTPAQYRAGMQGERDSGACGSSG